MWQWHQTMQASVNEHSQLEIDVFQRLQPVQVLLDGVPYSVVCVVLRVTRHRVK